LHKYLNYLGISFDSGEERFYHLAPMSQQGSDNSESVDGATVDAAEGKSAGAGGQIDGLQFARSGGLRAGALAADGLLRLAESGASPRNIEFRIEGGRDPSGFSVLAMPMVPRHERCGGDAVMQGKSGAVSPFEALAALKRGSRGDNGNEH
jgi:hypothetical protein